VDSADRVYVADTSNNRIQKFTPNGVFVTKLGSYGSDDGEFQSPNGVSVDSAGNVYVADSGNDRIQKFLPGIITVTVPNGGQTWTAGTTRAIKWTYEGATGTTVKIQLFKGGTFDRTIVASTAIGSAGDGSFSWAIPAGLAVGSNYKIKIISIDSPAISDISNNIFTINH